MSKFQTTLLIWLIICAALWTMFGLGVILIGYDPSGLWLFSIVQIAVIIGSILGYLAAKL